MRFEDWLVCAAGRGGGAAEAADERRGGGGGGAAEATDERRGGGGGGAAEATDERRGGGTALPLSRAGATIGVT